MVRKVLFIFAVLTHVSFSAVWINEIMASNKMTALDPDSLQYGDWIEIYNSGPFTVDLSGAYLTDDLSVPNKWRIPAGTTVPVNGYLLIWADGNDAALKNLHTNFKLDNDGETVGLFAADGTVVDTLTFKKQFSDISFGRDPKDPHRLLYFEQPTPGKANALEGYLVGERAGKVKFSLTPGFYRDAQAVLLSAGNGATIRYTLDGSTPTRNSKVYQSPIVVTRTTVIKARAYEPGLLPGPVETCTLFIDEESTLPVISISTESANLFSDEYGIYVDRNINVRKNWERPAVLEFFETNGVRQFAENVDLRLFGRTAIYIPQKSLAVFMNRTLEYPLFPGQSVQTFDSFILRSSSDDWHRTMFRDGFIQSLMRRSLTIDTQAYRPSVVFINGEYYGIHNIREKYNGDYLASYHGVDPDSLDLLYIDERQADPVTVLDGDRKAFDELIAYISSHDLAQAEHYAWVAERVDIDNFIDYIIAEAFTGNTSWAHNIRCWRPHTPDGKWQWLLFDMDRGFRDRNFNAWADMAEKFELFRNLLKNNEFKQRLVSRYAELINSAFQPEPMTALLDSLRAGIAAEMPRHIERWKDHCGNGVCGIPSMTDWQNNVNDMRSIVQARPAIAAQQLVSLLNLGRQVRLNVQVQQPNYGVVQIGSAKTSGTFSGVYFPGMRVVLRAQPNPGFAFVGWYGASASKTLLLPRGSTWRYFDQNNRPADNWYTAGYNDLSWKSGRAQFGYGENDEATVIDYGPDPSHKYMTVYFRTVFTVNDVSKI
ncbi:MAG: CotH kinase family protein, partial [candidate division KSB1 bacterium]|nr:CotH kinase family protein [candidate division KSB1 bacterium]